VKDANRSQEYKNSQEHSHHTASTAANDGAAILGLGFHYARGSMDYVILMLRIRFSACVVDPRRGCASYEISILRISPA
jgi:hypothetical protein